MPKTNIFCILSLCFASFLMVGCDPAVPLGTVSEMDVVANQNIVAADDSSAMELSSALKVGDFEGDVKSTSLAKPDVDFEQRLWQDYDYTFSTQATLTGLTEDEQSVKLLKSNGVDIVVPIDILSQEDKEYLKSLPESQKAALNR